MWYKIANQNKFKAVVDVDISVRSKNIHGISYYIDKMQLEIPFIIDLEYREWGIKSMSIYCSDVITIPYEAESYIEGVDNKSGILQVDLGKIPSDYASGNGTVTVASLDLVVDENFEVDYGKSEIVFLR